MVHMTAQSVISCPKPNQKRMLLLGQQVIVALYVLSREPALDTRMPVKRLIKSQMKEEDLQMYIFRDRERERERESGRSKRQM